MKKKPWWKGKSKGGGAWWKGKPGFCQTCGGRAWRHQQLLGKYYCECKPGCRCSTGYVPVPEHDFENDPEYDHGAYGEEPPEKPKASTQMMITGEQHTDYCFKMMQWKHPHTDCECTCH